jgi:hypothetical protein
MAQSHEGRLHARICKLSSTIDTKDDYVYECYADSHIYALHSVYVFDFDMRRLMCV